MVSTIEVESTPVVSFDFSTGLDDDRMGRRPNGRLGVSGSLRDRYDVAAAHHTEDWNQSPT
jgi:hypothetical protein